MASHSEGSESRLQSQQQSQQERLYQEEDDDLQLIDEEEDTGGTESEKQVQGESSRSSSKGKSTKEEKLLRRKMQNMINQRRYRQRRKEREEAEKRETENQDKATSSYVTADPTELQSSSELSGIPWGGLNMQYIVGRSRSREGRSRQTSREPSTTIESRAGGSSRLGLNLTDRFWRRRYPPWQTIRKYSGKDPS